MSDENDWWCASKSPALFDDLFDGTRRRFDARDTSTGSNTEHIVLSALQMNGYIVSAKKKNTVIAKTWGIDHTPDWLVRDGNRLIIVEVKYQGTTGSIYMKIPGEIARLVDSIRRADTVYDVAYIVIVSDGDAIPESFKQAMFDGEYRRVIPGAERVHCVSADKFITMCNRRKL